MKTNCKATSRVDFLSWCAARSWMRAMRPTLALTGARPMTFDKQTERAPGVQCRARVSPSHQGRCLLPHLRFYLAAHSPIYNALRKTSFNANQVLLGRARTSA